MKRVILIALIGLCLNLDSRRQTLVDCAKGLIGTPYEQIDCSGLTRRCYKKIGIELSTIAHNQFTKGRSVSKSELQPGDVVGFNNHDGKTQPGHVGMFIGGDTYIHSPGKGKTITTASLSANKNWYGGRNYLD